MTQISVASKRIKAHIEDVEKQKPETRTMKTLPKSLHTASAILALTATISVLGLTSPAYAEAYVDYVNCEPGKSVQDMSLGAQSLVETGEIEEMVVLKGASLKQYAGSLNALFGWGVPDTLSHIIVAVWKDGDAFMMGFNAGCLDGTASIVHSARGMNYRSRADENS